MSTTIDTRFAGGHLTVYPAEIINEPVVQLVAPGYELGLLPHEARALADALTTTAGRVEAARRPLRRPVTVDTGLRERDD